MNLYEIEYRYSDDSEWHNACVVGYTTNTVAGDTLDKIMDKANEDGDWGGVDKYLTKTLEITDSDVIFYLDETDITPYQVVCELQQELGVEIKDITKVGEYA